MKDVFIADEWEDLCRRLMTCVGNHESELFTEQATAFCSQPPPERYPDLLQRVSEAAELTKSWQSEVDEPQNHDEATIDESHKESFPAFNPPAWPTSHV